MSKVDDARATGVSFTSDKVVVRLADGREIAIPLTWYPRLHDAGEKDRALFELIGDGEYIHWPLIDEDLSVAGILRGTPSPEAGIKRRSE